MKKIIGLIFIAIIAFAGWKGWDYYHSTYIGKDYYAIIQSPLPSEKDIKADDGSYIGKGYKYIVDAYDKEGNERKLDFEVITSGDYKNGTAYKEGTILRLNASDKRIIEKEVISSDKLPKTVKDKLGIS